MSGKSTAQKRVKPLKDGAIRVPGETEECDTITANWLKASLHFQFMELQHDF